MTARTPAPIVAAEGRVHAPSHPFADRLGTVPAQVFDVPPVLLEVMRTVPIRRIAAESVRGVHVDLEV